MLGITYHNPATVSVYLDRMRFKDCFISETELLDGEWKRKLKSFVDLPSDGRDRVVFVESFAILQKLLQEGAGLDTVKVAVYDDCDVLSRVPGTSIVDAHINGGETDTWQLYNVSFREFNDALAAQPVGVPALIRDHKVDEDADLPEQKPIPKQEAKVDEADEEDEPEKPKSDTSVLVMEQILDDIEADDDEEEETVYQEPEALPDAALTARPEVDNSTVLIRKGQTEPVEPEPEEPVQQAEPEPAAPPAVELEREKPAKKKRKSKPKAPKLESYELF